MKLQFGCLELASNSFQPLEGAEFDIIKQNERVAAFVFMLKLIPFIQCAAVRATAD